MYVDIGMDLAVRASQVLGVFDLDNTSWSKLSLIHISEPTRPY